VLNLYPTNGSPVAKSYEIKGSWLVFDKGRDGETWYTKNPETGGGFNGDLAQGALGGMWQNIVNDTDTFGFNNDGEFFITSGLKNRDGKFWWNVMGEYEYNSTRQVLNLYWNGSGDTIIPDNYTVKFTVGDTVMELTEEYDKSITIFNKRDSL
jgi:hypothetical protein